MVVQPSRLGQVKTTMAPPRKPRNPQWRKVLQQNLQRQERRIRIMRKRRRKKRKKKSSGGHHSNLTEETP